MMPGYYGGMGGWGWLLMSLSTLSILALIGVMVWLLVRATRPGGTPPRDTTSSAREILAQRYARGEIDEEEYQQRLRILGG